VSIPFYSSKVRSVVLAKPLCPISVINDQVYCYTLTSLSESPISGKHKNRIPCRIDYRFYNYCSTCAIKYSKEIFRCKECNQKVRTRPWHRSKLEEWKRV